MKVGFIGLGIMGRPMAGHLQKGGHELVLLKHRSALPQELLDAGALELPTGREVAAQSDVLIVMVPDTPDVESVLFGENGVSEGVGGGTIVVDMSTISPSATKEFAERIRAAGGDYLDAPVSGGDVGAINGTLTIMVGGAEATFEKVKPLFELMGQNVTRIGEVGDGQTCKAANQIVVAMTLQAVCEAMVFAKKAGADPARVRDALMGGFASSRILEVHGQRLLERNFKPGFRVELHQKDLNIVLQTARALGMSLPGTALTQELFNAVSGDGGSKLDHSALVQATERLAGTTVAD
jgi:2-hydroxy-3-oxopropionate reductase